MTETKVADIETIAANDPETLGAIPATDREWREYLDRVAPLATTPAAANAA